jgi:hypothetical protein
MKKHIQVVAGELQEEFIAGWKRWADKVTVLETWEQADPEVTMVFGANLTNKFHRGWLLEKRPCYVLNRQFTGGWADKHRSMNRVAVNSYGATIIGSMSYSRWPILNLEKEPWKVKEVKNILIAPPLKSIYHWTGQYGIDWASQIKHQFDSENTIVRIREKERKRSTRYNTLWADLDWADLVVSYSSGITVEALWYGKQAISLGVCPTWVCSDKTLDNWRNPIEPDREKFYNHISWIQFKYEEWESGEAQELTYQYQGWPPAVSAVDNPIVL